MGGGCTTHCSPSPPCEMGGRGEGGALMKGGGGVGVVMVPLIRAGVVMVTLVKAGVSTEPPSDGRDE